MRIMETEVFGGSLCVVVGGQRSTVSVSLHESDAETSRQVPFGVLAYALPYRDRTVSSILKASTDQGMIDTATQVSQMLAALLQQPVFVNTTVRNADFMMLNSIKAFVTSEQFSPVEGESNTRED